LGHGQRTSLGIVGLCEVSENTFLCIIVDLMWGGQQWTFNNLNYNSRKACFRISGETAEAILPQSNNLNIHKFAPSPKPVRGRVYASAYYWP
jgi:hypothetical protein